MGYLQWCSLIATYAVATIGVAGLVLLAAEVLCRAIDAVLKLLNLKWLFIQWIFQEAKKREQCKRKELTRTDNREPLD